ncbi:hypothetical protein ACL9ST_04305 [Bacillus australimaris]|uniref:hypothetical protein n=1 Tax=Bacillus australimaris TaxID=1326968 RepID=UPI0039B639D9
MKEEEEPQQKIYTESELKGMNKIEQKAIAIDLGGDLSQLKDKMKELPIFSSINSNKKKQESKDDADLS